MFKFTTVTVDVAGRSHDYSVLRHPGAAAILPVERQRVLLVKQYRPAVEQHLLEVPAGTLEVGEEPLACARRELEEETGYRAGQLTSWGTLLPAPGYSAEVLYLYVAEALEPGVQKLDETEDISLHWYTLGEVRELLETGVICDSKTIVLLLRYFLKMGV